MYNNFFDSKRFLKHKKLIKQDNAFRRSFLIKKVQDLRLIARDVEDYKELKEIKKKIKEYKNVLKALASDFDFDSI